MIILFFTIKLVQTGSRLTDMDTLVVIFIDCRSTKRKLAIAAQDSPIKRSSLSVPALHEAFLRQRCLNAELLCPYVRERQDSTGHGWRVST